MNEPDIGPRRRKNRYVQAGWAGYGFAIALTAILDGPTAAVAVGGAGVLVVASVLTR